MLAGCSARGALVRPPPVRPQVTLWALNVVLREEELGARAEALALLIEVDFIYYELSFAAMRTPLSSFIELSFGRFFS